MQKSYIGFSLSYWFIEVYRGGEVHHTLEKMFSRLEKCKLCDIPK